ncbi:DNA polymerase kappa [Hypsizygus marmoreus]|uniref:DNA polymerase kappa n=1 Tax=Hypsizygus marmoreus TaxID=39966 RepID=A0A369JW10_HYPMA|nr:DNA polymerase kappa [Hypsizygus marmoreus]
MAGSAVEPPIASQETASLVRRLAGPSTGKAGLAKDQTEINRIIAEASKGSKFYDNEKKKDKDLTERIGRILRQRDDLMRNIDIQAIEYSVDQLLAELESRRDLSQTIVHVDMDAFYANVELLKNPDLEGKPFGVGRGVLSTASYEARKYGVRSGMPGFIAKKLCPDLILIPNHFSRYMDMSKAVMSIFERYDPSMYAAGCDEGYLNITQYCKDHNLTAAECVQEMRKAVHEETKLTASAGIAPNKMLAKICSDKNKPNGQFELPFDKESIISFLRDLSIRKIPGIGRVNERLLESIGIKTCGDIFTHRATIYLMDKQFGRQYLFQTHLGIASNVVQPSAREERKSIGAERTFSPISNTDNILHLLDNIAVELEKDMKETGWAGRTVSLKYKLDTYQVFTRAKSTDRWITQKEDLYAIGKELLLPEVPLTLRLIGLRVTKLKDLRAPLETANGIKRFFESIQSGDPRKRPKLNHDVTDADLHLFNDITQPQHELDDAMPGFHEHNEDNAFGHEDLEDAEPLPDGAHIAPEHPLASPDLPSLENSDLIQRVTLQSGSREAIARGVKSTPRAAAYSTAEPRRVTPNAGNLETHDCPICGKTLQTDNQGLNTHIDFCLSRGAIREAQAEASSPVKKGSGKLGYKPISGGKRK